MNLSLKTASQLGLALLLAVVAGILAFQWMRAAGAQNRPQAVRTQPLVVASRDLPAGTRLEPAMLKVAEFPQNLVPAQSYATTQELSGRMIVTAVSAGEPLTPSRLSGEAAAGGISAVITPGKRAMAVRGNKVMGLAGFIRPGNMVDVLVTLPVDNNASKTTTKLVLENVPVLAAGAQMTAEKDEAPSQADVYTLELTPHESEKLALASTQGTLHFALRNASDSEPVLTEGADTKTTLASLRARPAGRAARAVNTVEIITGSQKSQVSF